jgi:hypothetical protein
VEEVSWDSDLGHVESDVASLANERLDSLRSFAVSEIRMAQRI